jgi:hypothetical protein
VEYSKNAAAAVAKRRATQRQRDYMPVRPPAMARFR